MLLFYPAFWSRDMTIYLVFSAFTSKPVSLLATTKASLFFFIVCMLPPNIPFALISIFLSSLVKLTTHGLLIWGTSVAFMRSPSSCDAMESGLVTSRRDQSVVTVASRVCVHHRLMPSTLYARGEMTLAWHNIWTYRLIAADIGKVPRLVFVLKVCYLLRDCLPTSSDFCQINPVYILTPTQRMCTEF